MKRAKVSSPHTFVLTGRRTQNLRGWREARTPCRRGAAVRPALRYGMLDAARAAMLDALIPAPRLVEVDHVDLAAPPEQVWKLVRHGDLGSSPLVQALFAVRTLPERLAGKQPATSVLIDDLRSTPEKPGFSLLLDEPPKGFAVGAIGKVWQLNIPFVHVDSVAEFAAFSQHDFVKVAWSIRVLPLGAQDSRLELEVRVDATDDEAWRKFERYFRLIGPGSHFIRRSLMSSLARELGTPESVESRRPLPGDELLPAARAEATDGITISASPEQIWPWLLQMGCRRAGYYSVDWLDNGGARSSRELVPELLHLTVGQVIPATPDGDDGFEVLSLDAPRSLVLGGLYDADASRQLKFAVARPEHYWHVTWSFVLEPLNDRSTRLHVRARAAFPESGAFHASWIRPVHHFMQRRMLQHLAARVEERLPRDDYRDVLAGVGGAALMLAAILTPFLRHARNHWGVSEADANAAHVGDELVPEPLWSWTHGVEIDAPSDRVWRWVAQMGADRGGFYSYQWLENIAGCELRNADAVHPEWELEQGDKLVLHPKVPPLEIVRLERGRHLLAYARADEAARKAGKPWAAASWLFELEPLPQNRTRLITRYRIACSPDFATRLAFGPTLVEPIGFAMDRRLLLGIKARVERESRKLVGGFERSSQPHSSE